MGRGREKGREEEREGGRGEREEGKKADKASRQAAQDGYWAVITYDHSYA